MFNLKKQTKYISKPIIFSQYLHSCGTCEHYRCHSKVTESEVIVNCIICFHDVQVKQELSITLLDCRQELFLLIIYEKQKFRKE